MASDRYETARKSSPVKLDAPYSVYDPAAVGSYLNNRELPSTQNSFDPAWSKIYPQSSRNNASAFSTLDPN